MERDGMMNYDEIRIEPFTLIHDVLINWWVILLGAIGAALITSVIVSERYEPQYTTSATFAVSSKENANAYTNWSATYEMAETLEAILDSNSMRKIICKELDVKSFGARISTEILGETNLLSLRVTADTSKEAMDVMKAVINNYTKVSYYALGSAVMDVLEEPEVPMYPDNYLDAEGPAKKVFVLTAAALVCLFGLLSYMKDTIKCEKDIEAKLDSRSLGVIVYERKYKTLKELIKKRKKALLVSSPIAGFAFVEGYKKLAVKVDYQMKKYGKKTLVVTSVSENEGKSTVAANLAISLAEQSKRVILMEGDLRRPSQFLIFDKDPKEKEEIGEFLEGNSKIINIVGKSHIDHLRLVLGKNCYSSSTEKVASNKMKELLSVCEDISDYVIIDSPPAGIVGDAEILAREAGAVLVVAKQNYMLAEDINEILDAFRFHETKVVGVVLNGVISFNEMATGEYYGGYGGYGKNKKDRGV